MVTVEPLSAQPIVLSDDELGSERTRNGSFSVITTPVTLAANATDAEGTINVVSINAMEIKRDKIFFTACKLVQILSIKILTKL